MKNITKYDTAKAFSKIDAKTLKEGDVFLFYRKSMQKVEDRMSDRWVTELMIFQGYGNRDKTFLIFEGTVSNNHGMCIDVFNSENYVKLEKGQYPPVIKNGLRYEFAI